MVGTSSQNQGIFQNSSNISADVNNIVNAYRRSNPHSACHARKGSQWPKSDWRGDQTETKANLCNPTYSGVAKTLNSEALFSFIKRIFKIFKNNYIQVKFDSIKIVNDT